MIMKNMTEVVKLLIPKKNRWKMIKTVKFNEQRVAITNMRRNPQLNICL